MTPYYSDDLVTLFFGDCREVTEWLAADVLVTDPPYGRAWRQGQLHGRPGAVNGRWVSDSHAGIAGDSDSALRDEVLAAWGSRVAAVFGDLTLAPPAGNKQTLVYPKPPPAGIRGAMGGFCRDAEAIYLLGPWPTGIGGRSSIIKTGSRVQGNGGCQSRYGHPHAKPVDVMETLMNAPNGMVQRKVIWHGAAPCFDRVQHHALGTTEEPLQEPGRCGLAPRWPPLPLARSACGLSGQEHPKA